MCRGTCHSNDWAISSRAHLGDLQRLWQRHIHAENACTHSVSIFNTEGASPLFMHMKNKDGVSHRLPENLFLSLATIAHYESKHMGRAPPTMLIAAKICAPSQHLQPHCRRAHDALLWQTTPMDTPRPKVQLPSGTGRRALSQKPIMNGSDHKHTIAQRREQQHGIGHGHKRTGCGRMVASPITMR